MSDVFTPAKRSEVMSKIRGRGNKDTELKLIQIFRLHGITGWRRKWPVFGKPDFVFPKQKLAVFVDGCFWHRCPTPGHSNLPRNNAEFWAAKLGKNVERDQLVNRTLKESGWRVIRLWEHELQKTPQGCAERIARLLARASEEVPQLGKTKRKRKSSQGETFSPRVVAEQEAEQL